MLPKTSFKTIPVRLMCPPHNVSCQCNKSKRNIINCLFHSVPDLTSLKEHFKLRSPKIEPTLRNKYTENNKSINKYI